ncbi:hypothetical protein [Dactylosporangium sp. NPDC050588]
MGHDQGGHCPVVVVSSNPVKRRRHRLSWRLRSRW